MKTPIFTSGVLLAASLLSANASTSPVPSQNYTATAVPALEPFILFNTGLSLRYLTSDLTKNFGLFQQTAANGTFTGKISGTLPPSGNLKITYPDRYPGVGNGFATATLILNTTDGVPLSLQASGPVELGQNGEPVVKVVGSAFLQTRDESYAYLNEKAFVSELCGGTAEGENTERGSLYEVVSPLECNS